MRAQCLAGEVETGVEKITIKTFRIAAMRKRQVKVTNHRASIPVRASIVDRCALRINSRASAIGEQWMAVLLVDKTAPIGLY